MIPSWFDFYLSQFNSYVIVFMRNDQHLLGLGWIGLFTCLLKMDFEEKLTYLHLFRLGVSICMQKCIHV